MNKHQTKLIIDKSPADSLRPHFNRFLSTAMAIATIGTAHAQSTWQGTTSSDWATASNWSTDPALPAVGDDITIADITGNNLTIDADRTIGSLTFGDTGTRVANFTVSTGANTLTINDGIVAQGPLPSTNSLRFDGNVTVGQAQSWEISASFGNIVTNQQLNGAQIDNGAFAVDDNLTLSGSGALNIQRTTISGNGDIIVNDGGLRLFGNSGTDINVGGTGKIIVNNDAHLALIRNSGAVNITRDIEMNGNSSLVWRGVASGAEAIAANIAWNGTHTFANAGNPYEFSGDWSGSGTVNRSNGGTLILSGDNTAFTGTLNLDSGDNVISSGGFGNADINVGSSQGRLTIEDGANTNFSGTLTINLTSTSGSAVILNGSDGLGTGDVLVQGRQNFDASLEVANDLTVDNAITLQRGGGGSNRAILQLGQRTEWSGNITVDNTSDSGLAVINARGGSAADASVVSGDINFSTLGSGAAIWFRGGQWGRLTGSVDATTGTVTIIDSTNWEFSGASNTWGELALNNNGAIVTVGATNTLASTGIVTSSGTGILRLNNQAGTEAFDQTIGGLSSSVNVELLTGTATLTLNTNSDQEHTGSISGNISIVKDGPASQKLEAPALTGSLIVEQGVLEFNNLTGQPEVDVNAGSLVGDGLFGDVNVATGATLATGNGSETFLLQMSPGSTFAPAIDSGAPDTLHLVANDDVLIEGVTLTVSDAAETPSTLSLGTVIELIDYFPSTLTGTFAGLPEGSEVTVGPNVFTLSYDDDSRVTLTVSGTAPTTGYEDWLIEAGLTPGAPGTGPNDSFDASGVANIVQFGLGGSPLSPTNNGLNVLFDQDGDANQDLVLTIAVRTGANFAGSPSATSTIDGISYSVQGSTNLVDWSETVEEVTLQDDGGNLTAPAGYELKSFRLVQNPSLTTNGFLRVEVNEAP